MAFIGINIQSEFARLFRLLDLPGNHVPENEFHITILMFQDNWPIEDVAEAMKSIYEVTKDTDPFLISIDKITCFPKRENNPCAIIGKVNSKELIKLNKDLKKQLDKDKIEYDTKFKEYKPHMTLSYADDEIKTIKIDPVEMVVNELVLWAGDHGDDKLILKFPLKGVSIRKHANLIQQTKVFSYLSSKD